MTCPPERSFVHELTIANKKYLDTRFWDSPNSPYPYCQQNMDLYWPLFSTKNEDASFTCQEFVFYTDDQYQDHCSVTYPGL